LSKTEIDLSLSHCVARQARQLRTGWDFEKHNNVRQMRRFAKWLNAGNSNEINAAFAALVHQRADALFVGSGFLFTSRRIQLVHLATLHKLPATYSERQFAEVGGLMTYGANYVDVHRQIGAYSGRILKGIKPAELPVVQATKFELVINAETARMLGLTVPPTLLATADEVIE
jgi:putative tryptophan/tyrosine transport system substrate-binding protein